MILQQILVFVTDQTAFFIGNRFVRAYYHLWLASLVIFGPLLQFYVNPRVIFANKRNYFYVRFVESAWSWTCLLAGGYLLLLAYLSSGSLLITLRHLSRLTVGTGVRFLCSCTFSWIEDATGSCFHRTPEGLLLVEESQDKTSCLSEGHIWLGYDISSASFLLTYASLVLAEELAAFKPYLRCQLPAGAPLRLIYLLASTLLLLWNTLLLLSVIFFHQYSQKIMGAGFAHLCWHLTYHRWYLARWSPARPTQDLFQRPPAPAQDGPPRRCVCGAVGGGQTVWDSATETLLYRE